MVEMLEIVIERQLEYATEHREKMKKIRKFPTQIEQNEASLYKVWILNSRLSISSAKW